MQLLGSLIVPPAQRISGRIVQVDSFERVYGTISLLTDEGMVGIRELQHTPEC